ncbi:MAG: DUF721 domain-containing protein [Gammaproteobacteria bacterium]|nr:DUF721 domain-containing protein [Gammaproteobacteria bacterium]
MAPTPYIQYESMDSVKRIFKHLGDQSSQVEHLITRVMQQKRDNCLLESAFPSNTYKHCHFIRPSREQLVVLVDSSMSATQIKYAATDIINKINKLNGFEEVSELSVKLAPDLVNERIEKKNSIHEPIQRSDSASKILASLAETVGDEELASSLKKLAKNLSNNPN